KRIVIIANHHADGSLGRIGQVANVVGVVVARTHRGRDAKDDGAAIGQLLEALDDEREVVRGADDAPVEDAQTATRATHDRLHDDRADGRPFVAQVGHGQLGLLGPVVGVVAIVTADVQERLVGAVPVGATARRLIGIVGPTDIIRISPVAYAATTDPAKLPA